MRSITQSNTPNPPRSGPAAPQGRSGVGVASILPHLYRQQQINDKPAAQAAWEAPAQAAPRSKVD